VAAEVVGGATRPDAAGPARADGRARPRVQLVSLHQNETWLPEYADVPIHGNGALH
jgi:hypothetical protein